MKTVNTKLRCDCGFFQAVLHDVNPKSGTHLRCHCADCRAGFRVLRPGAQTRGIHLYQTDPDKVEIIAGPEYFECMQLSPNGIFRWYASCCNTPMFNTLKSAKIPFASVFTETAEDPSVFGPIVTEAHIKKSDGKTVHKGMGKMVFRMLSRMISSKITGRWKETPFFLPPLYGPVFQPRLVDKNVKREAYKS